MELTMFERLLQLPLFQGLTFQELSDLMAQIRLNFVRYKAGEEIVIQGEPCQKLLFIIHGDISTTYNNTEKHFRLTETLPPIGVLEPYNLFGMYQKYSRTYQFDTNGSILSIDKKEIVNPLMQSEIVKINMLNLLCNRYQQTAKKLCEMPDETVQNKIAKFIWSYSSVPKGKKEVYIKMTDLANLIHETRLKVSKALKEMQEQGMVTLQRGGIIISDIQDIKLS